ncbi:nicotinate-nucleotide--dimethylbenzimidazole phosphoribosyltransferase [Candidatus Poribacteria bacterium]
MGKLDSIIEKIEPIDQELMEEAQKRLDFLTKPQGSLGRLEELAKKLVGITREKDPKVDEKVVIVMAGDHGIVDEGVSAYPQEVTPQMVYNFIRGGAGINVLAKHVGADVVVVDMGVATDLEDDSGIVSKKIGYGTKNFSKGPAMIRDEAVQAIEAGIEVVENIEKLDILATGEMGIGNTTPSSAIIAAFSGCDVKEVTGRGTGVDDEGLDRKVLAIEKGLAVNKPDPEDALDVLSKVGGFEIAGLAGCVLAAAARKVPVVIDGFISTAGALIATELVPTAKEYIIASHMSQEIGHRMMLERMGLNPLLDLGFRLGEGTGAALAMSLVEAGVKILKEMATFADAGVSERTE